MTSNEHPDMSGNPCDMPLSCDVVRRHPAICCPECGRIAVYDEEGKNYPCERCGVLWRWYFRPEQQPDIVVTGAV